MIQLKRKDNKFLTKIPPSSGVYFFFDKSKKPLYIGKAVNLKNRLKQYSLNKDGRPFMAYLLEEAKTVDFKTTDSEIEALILESQYIKKLKPKYNIKLRDDKRYFYVAIIKDEFPKIFITHQFSVKAAVKYIGPFTDGFAIKTAMKLLRRIFPYCDCKQKHNNFCLNYHIGKCPGFCCLKKEGNKKRELIIYKRNIKFIEDVLIGKKDSLIKKLEKELKKLGKEEKFEEAIKLQKQTERLKKVFQNALVVYSRGEMRNEEGVLKEMAKILKIKQPLRRVEGYDISNTHGTNAVGSMIVFENGKPDKNQYRKFKIKGKFVSDGLPKSNDTAMLKEILTRRLNHSEWPLPDLILIDGGKGQLSAALSAVNHKIPIIALTKNKKREGVKIYLTGKKEPIYLSAFPDKVKNLILAIDAEAHRFAIFYYRKLHQRMLHNS